MGAATLYQLAKRGVRVAGIYKIPRTAAVDLEGVMGYLARNSAEHAVRMRDAMARDQAKRAAEIEESARFHERYLEGMRRFEASRSPRGYGASA